MGADEQFNTITLALSGVFEAAQANLWILYEKVEPDVLAQSQPVQRLIERFPDKAAKIQQLLVDSRIELDNAVYVPLIVKNAFWTIILDKNKLDEPYYIDIDSFEK